MSEYQYTGENCGTDDWAAHAAERICNLDGIRPHVRDRDTGDLGHMIGSLARIIEAEHSDGCPGLAELPEAMFNLTSLRGD